MINDFGGLSESGTIAAVQQTLERHVPMAGLQMPFGVLNIGVTKVAPIFVLDTEEMPLGLEMLLGSFPTLVPKAFFCDDIYYYIILNFLPLITFLAITRWRHISYAEEGVIFAIRSSG